MSDRPTPSTAAAVSRKLTVREVTTIRAALRLWIETPSDFISDRCFEEVDGAPDVLPDLAIEQLLAEVRGDGVAVTITRYDDPDGRRI
jgi:hypothetical protein